MNRIKLFFQTHTTVSQCRIDESPTPQSNLNLSKSLCKRNPPFFVSFPSSDFEVVSEVCYAWNTAGRERTWKGYYRGKYKWALQRAVCKYLMGKGQKCLPDWKLNQSPTFRWGRRLHKEIRDTYDETLPITQMTCLPIHLPVKHGATITTRFNSLNNFQPLSIDYICGQPIPRKIPLVLLVAMKILQLTWPFALYPLLI